MMNAKQTNLCGCLEIPVHGSLGEANYMNKLRWGSSVDYFDCAVNHMTSETYVSAINGDFASSHGTIPATGSSSFMNCVGFGVPLLTYNFYVDKKFLKKHKLTLERVYIMSTSREIFNDALTMYGHQLVDNPISIGGLSLDIGRLAQYMQPQAKTVVFLGARALDDDALTLIEMCRAIRVGVRVEEVAKGKTSILLILHFKKQWCELYFMDDLVTLSTSFIDKPLITKLLERTSIIFTSELNILLMPKVSKMIAYFCFSRFKHFVTILHQQECISEGKGDVFSVLRYTDVLFLTPNSAETFIEVFNVPCLSKCFRAWDIFLWMKTIAQKSCTVVVSDGLKKAYVHTDLCHGMSSKYISRYFKQIHIVDYYGVSRAFVGGFMAMMISGLQVDPCVDCGFFCASLIASRIGMTLPLGRESLVQGWYDTLDKLAQNKNQGNELRKRESNMPFTVFQTPWKEMETNAICAEIYKNIEKL